MAAPSAESTPIRKDTTSTYGILAKSESILSEEELVFASKDGIQGGYDLNQLITFNVFKAYKGTVFQSMTLWKETGMTAILYWVVFIGIIFVRWDGFSKFIGKESTIRAFIAMFSTLIGLLLSFYTALNLGRWWQMRLAVQHLVEGSKKLTMMVAHGCTTDPVLLQSISRYARASMFLIFRASQMEEGDDIPVDQAVKRGLLTPEEGAKLKAANPHMTFVQAETLWVWQANWVTKMHDQGLTKGAPHYCALMGAVEEGRAGVCAIQAYLETPIPLGYVHLLCLMVKLHNAILTILMAMTSVMLAGGANGFQPVGVFRTAFRAFFMPFLYNAILILNSEVTDPFGGDPGDFDWSNYDVGLAKSNESYLNAAEMLPDCIDKWQGDENSKV